MGVSPQTWSRLSADLVAPLAQSPQTCSRSSADLVAPLPQTWSRLSADLVALLIIRIQNTLQNNAEHHQNTLSKHIFRITEKGFLNFLMEKKGRPQRRMPPPEAGGTLTLYGHRRPRLYRGSTESQSSVSAKAGGATSDRFPAGRRRPSEAFLLSSWWLGADSPLEPFLTLLEISSGVWGQTAPTGYGTVKLEIGAMIGSQGGGAGGLPP